MNLLARSTDIGPIFFWGGLLLAAVIVLAVVVWWIRRWTLTDAAEPEGDIWSLQHLRELRRDGQISDSEFERLKSQVIAQFRPTDDNDDSDAQVPPS